METIANKLLISFSKSEGKTKFKSIGREIYIWSMGLLLLSYIYLFVKETEIDAIPIYIWILRIATVPLAIYYGRLWKDKVFLVLSIYLIWFFFRIFFWKPSNIFTSEGAVSILGALWVFTSCYGLGRILNVKELKRFLSIIVSIWIVGMACISLIGIYAVWTDKYIIFFEKGIIANYGGRLRIIYPSTTTGTFLSLFALVAFVCIRFSKKKRSKIFFIVSAGIFILALALTDSRSAYIGFAAGGSMLVMIMFSEWRRTHGRITKTSKTLWFTEIVFGLIIIFIVFLLLMMMITPVFNTLLIKGMIPVASAEKTESTKQIIEHRGFTGIRSLSGRTELWLEILNYLKNNVQALLIGNSKVNPFFGVDNHFVQNGTLYYYAHSHSIYVQILLESGAVGFLLVVIAAAITIVNTRKMLRTNKSLRWYCLLPAIAFSLMVGDIVECYIWLRANQCPMMAILFISIGIINYMGNKSSDLERKDYL